MIAQFKIFEEYDKIKYNVNDYVLTKFTFNDKYELVKIIEVYPLTNGYTVELTDGTKRYSNITYIKRKLTQEEINEYELIKITNKYNL